MRNILLSVIAVIIMCTSSGFATAREGGEKTWCKKGWEKKMIGRHSMSGTITDINHETGMVKLKTGAGEMTLHFPQPAIKDLKNGDTITAHMSFSKGEEKMKGEGKMEGKSEGEQEKKGTGY